MNRQENNKMDGMSGLSKTGVKDLSFKMVFIASAVHAADTRFGFSKNMSSEENDQEELHNFTHTEKNTVI